MNSLDVSWKTWTLNGKYTICKSLPNYMIIDTTEFDQNGAFELVLEAVTAALEKQ